ncbi:MAG: insulinase family protein [Marinilabiliales bacterium]|nr:MAG: insulinase family protein [Marinilabiliales bacterium]
MDFNRIQQPQFKNIEEINIPIPKQIKLDNGIETFIINAGTQEVLKIDLQFNAGSWYQEKPLIASTVNEMLTEGTKSLTSQQIAEKLDYYGAFINPQPTKDYGNISLYTLSKYLPETIKILEDVVKFPTFPEDELSTFLAKRKQNFEIELEKVNNIARREFNEQIFSSNHPYGKKANIVDYDNITPGEIIQFHKNFYNADNCKIILSGKVDDSVISILNQHFGNNKWNNNSKFVDTKYKIPSRIKKLSIVEKEDVTQSAIRLGKVTINRDHSDYHNLNIVNTILGGYFGSRLMKNIREDKGYTYGINSVLVSLKNAGYFVILSEVGSNVAKEALSDIITEIKKLREETISQEELNLVKNYMLGDILRSFDGAFEIASSFKQIIELGLDMSYFQKEIDAIRSIRPQEVKDIANKYLHEDTLATTVAGKYN